MSRNKITDFVEGLILEVLHQEYFQPRIVNILKFDRIHVSQSTVKYQAKDRSSKKFWIQNSFIENIIANNIHRQENH
jgi:hypothetical protein